MNLTIAIELVAKATVLLALAMLMNMALRRASAASQHMLWLTGIISVLALPLAMLTARPIRVPVAAVAPLPNASVPSPQGVVVVEGPSPSPSSTQPLAPLVFTTWIAGSVFCAIRFGLALWSIMRITKGAQPAQDLFAGRKSVNVGLLLTRELATPVTWGARRPVILFPSDAPNWPADRIRSAYFHEMSHVERRDWLAQVIAEFACCLYWFHPLVWLAAERLRDAAERACDDRVIRQYADSADYASHLVEVATDRRRPTAVLSMAHKNGLRARIDAVLDANRDRRVPGRRSAVTGSLAALGLLALIGAVQVVAQSNSGELTGRVRDASGAVVPGAQVSAENLDGKNQEAATTDAVGQFAFKRLPAGRYRVTIRAGGFQPYRSDAVSVAPSGKSNLDATLDLGGVFENIKVVGKRPQPAMPASVNAPKRIRVGGMVQATKLIHMVQPVYPPAAQQAGLEGTVLLQAVISTDGSLLSIKTVSETADPQLVQAVMDAVRLWRYEPTRLNGEPVEVVTTIAVSFRLDS